MKRKAWLVATLGSVIVVAPACGARSGLPLDSIDGGSSLDAQANTACERVLRQEVGAGTGQVDVVWGVDTSGSMLEESLAVQENINAFSQQITAAGIDVHVVMLAGYPCLAPPLHMICRIGLCVPPPLGNGIPMCSGGDSKPPNFFHHPSAIVDSNDGAVVFVDRFPDYRHMLRPGSTKYLVIVTDDDSTVRGAGPYADNPDRFIADYTALDPMMRSASGAPAWKLSGMYAHSLCANAARVGTFWKSVIDKTGGVHGDICECNGGDRATCAQAFKTLFDSLAKRIVTSSKPLECEYVIPSAPAGQTFDLGHVDFELVSNGATETIGRVDDRSGCDPKRGGWYYDDNDAPARIFTCPESCEKIKAVESGSVTVVFACAGGPTRGSE